MRLLFLGFILAAILAGCAAQLRPSPGAPVQTLMIRWQRLVDSADQTCPRCALTERDVHRAYMHLKRSLSPAGIRVILVTQRIDEATFREAPLESNRIWIGDRPLEGWLGAETASSSCCDACGDAECRTISVGGRTYEAIPAALIVRAGLMAAGDALRRGPSASVPGEAMPTPGGDPQTGN
jgi:hypothetical protein